MNGVRYSLTFVRKVRSRWLEGKNTRQIALEMGFPESSIYNAMSQGDGSYTPPGEPLPREIMEEVAHVFGVSVGAIKGHSRLPYVVEARWAVIHILRTVRHKASPQIGRMVGRDPTTVLAAVKKTDEWLSQGSKAEFQLKYQTAVTSLRTGAL